MHTARTMFSERGSDAARRRAAAAALILHLLMTVLLPLVGSTHERVAADQRTHIEEAGGSPACPRRNDHQECIVCRFAPTALAISTSCRYAQFDDTIRESVTPARTAFLPGLLQSSPPASRAPPVS